MATGDNNNNNSSSSWWGSLIKTAKEKVSFIMFIYILSNYIFY